MKLAIKKCGFFYPETLSDFAYILISHSGNAQSIYRDYIQYKFIITEQSENKDTIDTYLG